MALKLPQLPKLTLSKLQALLLLGGAFVFGVSGWFLATHRLVTDFSPFLNERVLGSLTFVGAPEHASAFIASLPEEAQKLLEQVPLARGHQTTLFAYRSLSGDVRWAGAAEAARSPEGTSVALGTPGRFSSQGTVASFGTPEHLEAVALGAAANPNDPKAVRRWIRRDVQAFGFLTIDGRQQNVQAYFEPARFKLVAGRAYRGVRLEPHLIPMGPRLFAPMKEQIVHLQKPSGADWGSMPQSLQAKMQRFPALAEPWTWPGSVEITVSASATGQSLLPFVLLYQPPAGQPLDETILTLFGRSLLSEAVPQPILVKLPDESEMTEYRKDPNSVKTEAIRNPFGVLWRFTLPGEAEKVSIFKADTGDVWISNDVSLIQAALFQSIGASGSLLACGESSPGGFASFPGKIFSEFGQFKDLGFLIKSSETGLFTICGYY